MATQIVTINVSQQIAPAPSTLQRTGALVSQGGTTTAAGTLSLLTRPEDLTPILRGAAAIASISWLSNVVTVNTTTPHGLPIGADIPVTIAGATPTGYNGNYTATVVDADTFTYPLLSNPGASVTPGTYVPRAAAELSAMVSTFYAQGSNLSVYVMELGPDEPAIGAADLQAWLVANPSYVYSFLVPRAWADEPAFYDDVVPLYEAPDKKTYFYVTATLSNYTNFTSLMKCVKLMVEAPSIPSTEFSHAADFWVDLHYDPGITNKVTPNAFSYLYGVTPYPTVGNAALLSTLKTAHVNIVGTGAEGGIATAILLWGTTMDGNDFTYWYSVDWVQIHVDQDIANAIINGSNNPINPLYYTQHGIDRLLQVVASTMGRGVSYGLVLGPPIELTLTDDGLQDVIFRRLYPARTLCNAVPFIEYNLKNPSHYAVGRYDGLSTVYTPSRGFTEIVFNIVVSQFVVA